jgi:hypothetical protein
MKPTPKLRFVRRAVPDKTFGENISVYKHILQQWWETVPMGTVNLGWTGDIPLGEVQGEWRDIPIEEENT